MELTRKQEEGLRIAVERYHQNEPYTVISGYAGTGKSTLIKFIISALDVNPERVAYIAYTGKAAQVLRNKGCPTAMTAHRLLYKSLQRAMALSFIFRENRLTLIVILSSQMRYLCYQNRCGSYYYRIMFM